MDKKHKLPYSPEFKLEGAQGVTKQGYRVIEGAKAMGVSKSAMSSWVNQGKGEGEGKSPSGSPMTQEQQKSREGEKKMRRIEEENSLLKKASALLMSDFLNTSRE